MSSLDSLFTGDKLRVPNQQTKILHYLFKNEDYADVSLFGAPLAANGQQDNRKPVRACKNVLAAGSEYFRTLFSSEFADANKSEYTLEKISHGGLKLAVEVLHNGEVLDKQAVADVKTVCDLLETAQYLIMKDLTLACEKFLLERHLTGTNCIILWKTACNYPVLTELNSRIDAFLPTKLAEFMLEESFLQLSANELYQLMNSKSIKNCAIADVRFNAVLAWLEYDAEKRRNYSDELLDTISLTPGKISRQSLVKVCHRLPLVFTETAAKRILDFLALSVEKCMPDFPYRYYEDDKVPVSSNCFSSSSSQTEVKSLYCIGGHAAQPNAFGYADEKYFIEYKVSSKEWIWNKSLPWKRKHCGACVIDDYYYQQLVVIGGEKDGVKVADIDECKTTTSTGCWYTNNDLKLHAATEDWLACNVNNTTYFYNGTHQLLMAYLPTKGILEPKANSFRKSTSITYSKQLDAIFATNEQDFWIDKYDVAGNVWVGKVAYTSGSRRSLGAALCGADDLFLAGGQSSDRNSSSKSVEMLNIRTGQKAKLPDLPTDRPVCHAVTLYNNVVCVLGGGASKSVDAYDVREGKWSTGNIVPDMPLAMSEFGFTWK